MAPARSKPTAPPPARWAAELRHDLVRPAPIGELAAGFLGDRRGEEAADGLAVRFGQEARLRQVLGSGIAGLGTEIFACGTKTSTIGTTLYRDFPSRRSR